MGGRAATAKARQSRRLFKGRVNTMLRLRTSSSSSRVRALPCLITPRASGRLLVRSTFPSNLWSQRSLAMQPAPLTVRPPKTICRRSFRSGGAVGVSQSDHAAGTRRISRPVGLFHRSSSIHGRRRGELLITITVLWRTLVSVRCPRL